MHFFFFFFFLNVFDQEKYPMNQIIALLLFEVCERDVKIRFITILAVNEVIQYRFDVRKLKI